MKTLKDKFDFLPIFKQKYSGHGGGQVVSMLAFYSNDPSLNPADAYSFCCYIVFERMKINKKEAGVGPFKKTKILFEMNRAT